MLIRVPMLTVAGTRRPDLPEGSAYTIVQDDGDAATVNAHHDEIDIERWAVERGTHTPASVRTGRLFISLRRNHPDVYLAVINAAQSDGDLDLAIRLEPTISRSSTLLAGLQQALGLSDEWVDNLFRTALLIDL